MIDKRSVPAIDRCGHNLARKTVGQQVNFAGRLLPSCVTLSSIHAI